MTIEQLMQLAQTRHTYLTAQLTSVAMMGDVSSMERIIKEITDTEHTIEQLKSVIN